ncbi:MAG: hypothetical protein ACYYK0_06550 [Candidatus Eutrophobiaceae bacterium]
MATPSQQAPPLTIALFMDNLRQRIPLKNALFHACSPHCIRPAAAKLTVAPTLKFLGNALDAAPSKQANA